jgi:hypothetical protein
LTRAAGDGAPGRRRRDWRRSGPVDAIARDCGLQPGTVKTRLAAGRQHLELITQCGDVQQEITGGKVTRIRLPMIIPNGLVGDQNTFAW